MSLPKFNLTKLKDSIAKQQTVTKKDIRNLLLLDRLQSQIAKESSAKKEVKLDKETVPYGSIGIMIEIEETSSDSKYSILTSDAFYNEYYRENDFEKTFDLDTFSLTEIFADSFCINKIFHKNKKYKEKYAQGHPMIDLDLSIDHYETVNNLYDPISRKRIMLFQVQNVFEIIERSGIEPYENAESDPTAMKRLEKDIVKYYSGAIKRAFSDAFVSKGGDTFEWYNTECDVVNIPPEKRRSSIPKGTLPCFIGAKLINVEVAFGTDPNITEQ